MNAIKNKKVDDLKSISILMDSQFTGPWGFRFGLDGIIGLIPIVGDLVTTALSLYVLIQAATLGCSGSTLVRMGLNIAIENIIDAIPILGHFFDFFWKANNKNIALLEEHMLNPRSVTLKSRMIIGTIIFVILGIIVASGFLTVYLIQLLMAQF